METIFIVNLNVSSFFRYNKINIYDDGYDEILLNILTPIEDDFSFESFSHWSRTDKIIIAPKHLHSHIEKIYGELFF
jgi:hypothetical protein